MGVCFMLVILKQFFLPNLKVAATLLCLTFVYGAQALAPGAASTRAAHLRPLHRVAVSSPPTSIPHLLAPPACATADVWWVFLQPIVTGGQSVMIEVATGGASHEQLPMVLRVPHHVLGTNPAFALLGLGERRGEGLVRTRARRLSKSTTWVLAVWRCASVWPPPVDPTSSSPVPAHVQAMSCCPACWPCSAEGST